MLDSAPLRCNALHLGHMAEPGQVAMSSPLYMPDLGLAPTAKLAVPCGPRQRARERSLDNVKEPLPRRFVGCARIVRHRNSAPGHVPEPEFGTCHHILLARSQGSVLSFSERTAAIRLSQFVETCHATRERRTRPPLPQLRKRIRACSDEPCWNNIDAC